jgi:hypothetical protein
MKKYLFINLGFMERNNNMDPIYIPCSECNFGVYTHEEMVEHILSTHPSYSRVEAEEFAYQWEEAAYEEQEAENIWKAKEYRRTGVDPDRIDEDPL